MLIALVVIGLVMADHWRQKTEEIRQTRADGLVKVFANAQNMVQKYQQLNAGAVPASTAVMVAALSPAATTSEVTFESNQITVTPVAAVKGVVLTMQNLSPDIASRATVKLQGATLTLGATARIDYPYAGDPTTATLSGFLKTDGTNSMLAPLTFGVSQTVGAACTTGQIGRDASGNVLACVSSVWKQAGSAYWQDPVANMATLNGSYPCSASVAWQTRVVQAPSVGSGPRAYTCDGTTWQALAVNDSGNLTIAGTATINALNGNLQVTAMAAEGAACTGEGRIASSTTTSGLILSCQSGVWKKASGSSAGGTGLKGAMLPQANKSISCSANGGTAVFYGTVAADGTPSVRIFWFATYSGSWRDTGYVSGAASIVDEYGGTFPGGSAVSLIMTSTNISGTYYSTDPSITWFYTCRADFPLS